MEIRLPADCGNAPRIGIVNDVLVAWARGDRDAVSAWLAEDVEWNVVGGATYQGRRSVLQTLPEVRPDTLAIHTTISHGRFAACDATLTFSGQGAGSHAGSYEAGSTSLSVMVRFTSAAAATGRIAQVRAYVVKGAP